MVYQIDEAPLSISDPCRSRDEDMSSTHDNAVTVLEGIETPINTHGINLSRIETRLDLVKEAARTLPLNEFNLPTYIYRTDLLNVDMLDHLEDMLTSAKIFLEYHHGFPTIKNDLPLWSQLEWEPKVAFEAFLQYLELPGGRTLRGIPNIAPDLLVQYYHMYYWGPRALSFDMFVTAHHERLRHQRIFEIEDTHWQASKTLFARLNNAVERIDDDKLAEMEPDKLIKMMAAAVNMQRLAAGLPTGGHHKGAEEGSKAPSIEVSMRQMAENSGVTPTAPQELDFSGIYNDPEALKAAQSIIIKVNR